MSTICLLLIKLLFHIIKLMLLVLYVERGDVLLTFCFQKIFQANEINLGMWGCGDSQKMIL